MSPSPEFVEGEVLADDAHEPTWSRTAPVVDRSITDMVGFEPREIITASPPADKIDRLRAELEQAEADLAERAAREQARRERVEAERIERERGLVERVDDLARRIGAAKDVEPGENPPYRTRAPARRFVQSFDPRHVIGCGDDRLVTLAELEIEVEHVLAAAEDDAPGLVERVDALEAVIWSALTAYARTLAGEPVEYPVWKK